MAEIDLNVPLSADPSMMELVREPLILDRSPAGEPVMRKSYTDVHRALAQGAEGAAAWAAAEAQLKVRDGARLAPTDALRLRTLVEKGLTRWRTTVEQARESVASDRESLVNERDAALKLPEYATSVTHGQRAADVRSALRRMGADQRAEMIREAVQAGDTEAVASILSASPLASGLGRDEYERLRVDAHHRFAPGLTATIEALDKTRTILDRAHRLIEDKFAPMLGESDDPAGRAEAAMRRAEMIGGAA